MKHFKYVVDCGSIMIGTDKFKAHYSNGIGDGQYNVYIMKNDKWQTSNNDYKFIDCIEGEFNIYNYDCPDCASVLITLKGRYGVYCNDGDIILEKWEN